MNVETKKWMLALTLGATVAALTGCGTVSKQVASDGSKAETIVFPDAKEARPKGGIFPSLDNLRKIESGVTKAQVQNLLGPPHFHEGIWDVREWDYLFNFRKDGQVLVCQYKVLFDKDKVARSFYWSPESCADLLKHKHAEPMKPKELKEPLRLSADALFDFDRADLKPQGRERLAGLLDQLRTASEVQNIRVVGYTDRIGSDSYNMKLSEHRAETVRDYLTSNGMASAAIQVEGRGKADPVVDCKNNMHRAELIACLAPNRRVELTGVAKP
ncbi:OmpA family protein [Dyella tabacisoli]|uniref:Outer membrane protein assembly factor BamE n=1 Tax=Dyella tabacisoli TaxID=2282381 RepID=A0A369ULB8_9GAMM|nr:OmpA family protein [Dyella tabacisoli]RDD81321.1 outer membrane protein assembly factor BamE [Dyella tabacisoli]